MCNPETWFIEDIPDDSVLLYRVFRDWMPELKVRPNVFREAGGSMSTNWDRYSTASETREQVRSEQLPDVFVIALNTEYVRKETALSIKHSPDHSLQNRAHTDVFGLGASRIEKVRLRNYLFDMYESWVWAAQPN
jgi:hypothetical protein